MWNAGRQTRHQLWCDFASQSLQTAGVEASEGKCVTKIGPPSKVENGQVVYQLLVVKPAAAASAGNVGLRFCVPTSVWRVARRKVKSGKRLMTEGKLPIEYISRLQVMLLMPRPNPNNKSALELDGSQLGTMFCIVLFCFVFSVLHWFMIFIGLLLSIQCLSLGVSSCFPDFYAVLWFDLVLSVFFFTDVL